MHITCFMHFMQPSRLLPLYSSNTETYAQSCSLLPLSFLETHEKSSRTKLHSLVHSNSTIWRMWNSHRSRASKLVFKGSYSDLSRVLVLWWSSVIVAMLNRRIFVVRIDIIWKKKKLCILCILCILCSLCNLCKLLHYYVIYAFYVIDCIIMQIMNIPCIFLHSGQN